MNSRSLSITSVVKTYNRNFTLNKVHVPIVKKIQPTILIIFHFLIILSLIQHIAVLVQFDT